MKKQNLYFNLFLVVLFVVASAGCDLFEKKSRAYDGPTVLEFYPQSASADEGSGQQGVEIQLIGPQQDSDMNVNYSVVDSMTTAESGTYAVSPSSPVTIPANSSQTQLTIDVQDNPNMGAGETRKLTLIVTGNDEVQGAKNLKYFTMTIEGQ